MLVGLSRDLGLVLPGQLPVVIRLSFSRWNLPNRELQLVMVAPSHPF